MVSALLAVEDLDVDDALRTAIATLTTTVLLSVILHGLTADVFAARYGAWIDRTRPPAETRHRDRASPSPVARALASPPLLTRCRTARRRRRRAVRQEGE